MSHSGYRSRRRLGIDWLAVVMAIASAVFLCVAVPVVVDDIGRPLGALPKYHVLKITPGNISDEPRTGFFKVPDFSRAHHPSSLEWALRGMMEREGVTGSGRLYATDAAFEWDRKPAYRKAHPAAGEGFLGWIDKRGRFHDDP